MTRRVSSPQLELVPGVCARLQPGMRVRIPHTNLVFEVVQVQDGGETVLADRDFFPGVASPGRRYVADGLVIESRDG